MSPAKFATITHFAEGIRMHLPSGIIRSFPNSFYLAESYARAVMAASTAHELIVADLLNRLRELQESTKDPSTSEEKMTAEFDFVHARLAEVVSWLAEAAS
jgi:hypothetical protein